MKKIIIILIILIILTAGAWLILKDLKKQPAENQFGEPSAGSLPSTPGFKGPSGPPNIKGPAGPPPSQ